MKTRFWTVAVAALALSQLGATDCGQAIRDDGFDLWCGQSLCAWKVERGEVKQAPTWNAGDLGVSLVGSDDAIEQLSPIANTDGNCIEFDVIANIDEQADVELNIDVFGDGSVEYTQRIPTTEWKPQSFLLPIQGTFGGIRFEIAKRGAGSAVLAQLSAQVATGCSGLPPIIPQPAPDGAVCITGAGCRSGLCNTGACASCTTDADCTTSEVCGLGAAISPVDAQPRQCVTAGQKAEADNCAENAECQSGICTDGACSTCLEGGVCMDSAQCEPAWQPPSGFLGAWHTPWECSPLFGLLAAGAPCANDGDCQSNHCSGTPRSQCDDGRECATAADCPFGGPGTTDPLQQGPCTQVGIQGGSCQ